MYLPVYAAYVPAVWNADAANADAATRIQQLQCVAQALGSPAKAYIDSIRRAYPFVHRLIAAVIMGGAESYARLFPLFPHFCYPKAALLYI
jgi:hypothetical protein